MQKHSALNMYYTGTKNFYDLPTNIKYQQHILSYAHNIITELNIDTRRKKQIRQEKLILTLINNLILCKIRVSDIETIN